MVVSEGAINNIMGGMENTAGVRLHSHRHKLKQRFDIIRKLGQGTYGKVQLAVNKETGQEVAIKTIKKAKIETEQDLIRIRREIQIMSSVQHPQIIHIYEVFENREKMVLVMEYAAGGELYDYLSERKVLSEDEARRIFRHVASATYYCHKHKICHRDLKLENILLDLDGNAKIADFGLSNVFDEKHRLDTFCGSPLYASPEIVKGIPYTGPEVDCWSLGVLLYTLVYGAMPFDGSNFKRLVKQITQGDYYEPKKPSRASDLIRQMLTVSATKRATIEDICNHWWVNEGFLEPCLEVAEALANQTPVRLDLLLSLAPKHINSEHMLIQPEEDDSARSPPTSEVTRPPPQLQLPPPPPPDALPTPTARSASLGAVTSINRNEIEALLARKIQEKKEEEKKRKANESGVMEKKKKRDSTIEGTPKPSRKERKADVNSITGESGSSRRPPTRPDSEISDRKKSVKKREPLLDGDTSERDKSERSERKRSVKKREPVSDGDVSHLSEKSERRKTVKKRESSVDKDISESDRAERKKSVKKLEPSVDKEISESERTEKRKSVKKRESSVTRESFDDKVERRKSTIKKESVKEKTSSKTDSEAVIKPLSVINGENREYNEAETGESRNLQMDTSEDQLLNRSLKPPLPKDQVIEQVQPLASDMELSRSDSEKTEVIENLHQLSDQTEPMEVEPVTPTNASSLMSLEPSSISASMRSVASSASNDGTLKASDSSLSRESVSPQKTDTGAPPQLQDTPKKSSSPSQTPKVSDAKKAFETKPAEKSKVVLRKKPTTESLPSSPTNKEGPKLPTTLSGPITSHDAVREGTPTKEMSSSKLNKDKSPVKDVSPGRQEPKEKSVTKETEKEQSPKKIKEITSEEITKPASPRPSVTETEVQELEDEVSPVDKIEKKVHEETEEKEKLDEVKSITRIEKPHVEKLITPRTSTHAMEVDPLETVTSSEEEEAVVVGGLNLKLGGVGKISEVGTKQEVRKAELSDSSDSESEAEKLLKMVSEKREKVEAARQEKLRKVSEAKDRELKNKDMPAIREEPQSKSPSKSPSISPEKAVKLSPSETRESAPEQKFATLPRGFKAKTPRAAAAATTPSPLPLAEKLKKEDRKDKAISQEIEGMMSAIKAVDQAITKGPGETIQKSQEAQAADRKKTQLEIILDNKKSDVQEPDLANKRASYAEIKLTSPTAKDTPKTQEYKSEVRHNVGPVHGMGEAQLQRAKRERIIPIMIEDDDDDDDLTTSESLPHSDRPVGTSSSAGSRVTSPLPSQLPNRRTSDPRSPMYKPSPEPIRKSPRERIIPIAVEGEGIVTPPPHVEEAAELGAARAHQAFSRTLSGRPSSLNRGRGFLLDHSESFSSAGEEEEEDEDDGFQILTAESLFSTLLNRVRSLTRKMNADEVRSERGRRSSNRPTPEPNTAPNSAGIGAAHSASSGFWSSLYNSPRDSPARRISETMSRSSLGRDDDTLGGLTSPLWTRSVSRDTSDADTLFSEASTPFGTLPRGWRASRWSGGEDGGESDTSEASARSLNRRPQYSRAPSRELHNIPDEELGTMGGTAYPGSGMSLPRPYPASSAGNLPLNRGTHDSADRIAAMYGTLRSPHRRPHSTVGGQPGECIGRDGGLCEQQLQRPATPNAAAQISMQKDLHASQLSPSSQVQHPAEDTEALKQSVHEQLQQLVRELEAGDDQAPEVSTLPKQQHMGNNTPHYDQFSVPHGSPVYSSGTPKHSSSSHLYSPKTLPHSSSKPMYSSNPALHMSCIPMQPSSTQTHSDCTLLNSGYQGTPKMTKNIKEKNEDIIRKNMSLAKDKQSGNNAPLIGRENTSKSCEMGASVVKNTLPSSTTSTSNIPILHTDTSACDQKNHAVSVHRKPSDKVCCNSNLDFSQEGATSDGDAEGDTIKQASTSQEQRLRSSNKVVRSADRSALDAYRRSRGRGEMQEYHRGKSEDLCHTLNSLSRLESSQRTGLPVRALFNNQNVPDINTKVTAPNIKKAYSDMSASVTSGTAKNMKQNQVMGSGSNNNSNNNNIDNNHNNNNDNTNNSNRKNNNNINNSNINGSVLNSTNLATSQTDLTANTIPRVSNGGTNNDKNNNSGIITSRSTSGIPLKSNSRSSISTRSSYSGNSNSSTSTRGNSELLQPKMYQRSKSKELTPAIEAASEKFSQLNSGTLKRISPFEAYRRTKSRELPTDTANKEPLHVRLKSPPPAPDRAKSPFEKAKTTIEKKFEYTKSPLAERATGQKTEGSAGAVCAPLTPNLNQSTNVAKEKKGEKTKIKFVVQEENKETEQNNYEHKNSKNEMDIGKLQEKERACEKDKEKEKGKEKDSEKERGKVKKTSSCDPEKPKSMYKLIASRFNRSGSNVADNNRSTTDKRSEEDDANEKEDKFRLKRPSRFLKHKTEKSSSKSSVCDGEGVQDDSERPERKPSKKLTDALNKFLGRKDTKEDPRSSLNSMSQPAMPTISTDDEQPKKPPRVKPKKFSKSQENLCLSRVEEGGETVARSPTTERAQSVVPDSCPTNLHPSYTLESVTKSICDHLSQLESDITSRIGNMGVQESGAGVRPTGGSRVVSAVSSVPPITTYGLSPALAHRRSARPTNLDLAGANIDNHDQAKPPASARNTTTNHIPNTDGERVKYAQIKKLDGAGDIDPSGDTSQNPTESESTTTGFEDIRGLSENEDESVMDRITRKSYYSKFQNKKKPQLRRANTKEDMDQQLAAAKARLMKEDAERAVRESLSPLRYTSPVVSPRASVTSPPSWDVPRRHSRKSLPPEDPSTFLLVGRRGTSLQPDDLLGIRRLTSVQPGDRQSICRVPSLPSENCPYTQRAPSMPLEDYSSSCRMKSIPPEDHLYTHRAPSIPSDDFSSKCHLKSIPCNDSKTSSLSPVTDNELNDEQVQEAVAVAAAAGALAGEAAAGVAAVDSTNERGSSRSREPSVNRVLRPEHANRLTPARDDTRSLAREELSRRLTHLTRISGTSGLSGWNRGGLAGGGNTGNMSEKRSYRRTNTTGHLGDQLSGSTPSSINPGLGERPVYRRTNTMDLPPADARARPGSEYRRQLQDPARRYSAASLGRGGDKGRFFLQETLVEGEVLTTPSSRLPSSHLTSSPLSSPSSYHRGYSTMDSPRYTSTLSSTVSPLPRRTSFYRY